MKLSVLIGFLVAILQIVASQEWCPEDCKCLVLRGNRPRNHATCSSVKGLLQGKDIPLHSINLSNVNLTKISHLEKLRILSTIDLSHNQLANIDHLGRRIKSLNLKHNKITSAKLTNIPRHVENLDLSFNEITYLPLELTKLKNLKSFELVGNKINCTCETIEVRNWLQSRHIWTENPIKCSYPAKVKDLPWLQVKQSVICDNSSSDIDHDSGNENDNDNDNDMMLGDEPILNEGSAEKESVEELGKDFLPVEQKPLRSHNIGYSIYGGDEDEGSGDGPQMAQILTKVENETELDNEGSSSGMGMLFIPHIIMDADEEDENNGTGIIFDNDKKQHVDGLNPVSAPYDEVTSPNLDIIGPRLLPDLDSNTEKDTGLQEEVSEDTLVPIILRDTQAGIEKLDGDSETINADKASIIVDDGNVNRADSGENKGTYILLGIIIIVVIALILFVAVKRVKAGHKNRFDPENQRGTELADMDKKNLGKPMHKNGNGNYEHKPLIADKTKADLAKPINGSNRKGNTELDDSVTKEPLLNEANKEEPAIHKSNKPESNNNLPVLGSKPNDQDTIPEREPQSASPSSHSPRYGGYPPPKSPRPAKSLDNTDDEVFLPSSPRQGRYSPVYSPETGKVKIKLTETPRPKTPKIVTRNRPNASELIPTTTTDTVDTNQ